MNIIKKGKGNNHLICGVCKINFTSSASFALHEFSKKHCDNLIKIAKCKPVVNKQKLKNKVPQLEKEPPKENVVTDTGSFSVYGYFAPDKIYKTVEMSKEFNTEYDPYLQKFAENPFKEKLTHLSAVSDETQTITLNKKKKGKVKTCQICNITLRTVPEYEAHMKSSEHIWKLKVTGIGVSAHFVKASTNLHTTDINEDSKQINQTTEQVPEDNSVVSENVPSFPFSLLYCQDCDLLLNSSQQYNAHLSGKSHIECVQKKAKLKANKEKSSKPMPNQLYCYSCKISLNNLFQYNEHKNGKKHKTKCMQLVKKGISIPPEERFPGLINLKFDSTKSIKYSELYEKFVLLKQDEKKVSHVEEFSGKKCTSQESYNVSSILPEIYQCGICNIKFETLCHFQYHMKTKEHNQDSSEVPVMDSAGISNTSNLNQSKTLIGTSKIFKNDETNKLVEPKEQNTILSSTRADDASSNLKESSHTTDKSIVKENFSNHQTSCLITNSDGNFTNFTQKNQLPVASTSPEVAEPESSNDWKSENQITVIAANEPLKCNICSKNFSLQKEYDMHLNTEEHFQKILELKSKGCSETEILKIIFFDKSFVKPDSFEKLNCSICNVSTNSKVEFEQHLKSIVHKYAEKDFKRKKLNEVKHILPLKEIGLYFCKLCKEEYESLANFIQHLHCVKHKSIQSEERTKKILARKRLLKNRKLDFKMKKQVFSHDSLKNEKNLGVRTKIGGIAIDLCTGTQVPIPNFEPLEPKIDQTKNVHLGVSTALSKDKISKKSKTKKFIQNLNLHKKSLHSPNDLQCQRNSPLLTTSPGTKFSPTIPNFFQPYSLSQRPFRPAYFLPYNHWNPFSNSYQNSPRLFQNRPQVRGTPYLISSWYKRPYFPGYTSTYR